MKTCVAGSLRVTFSPAALVFICMVDFTTLSVSQISLHRLRVLRGIGKNLEGSGHGLLDILLIFLKSLRKTTYTSGKSVSSDQDSNRVTSIYKQEA
jgi:hypothetical protein